MKTTIITYFEQKDHLCGVGFSEIEDINLFEINPPFIQVDNDVYDDEIYVLNNHEFEYIKPIEGVNRFSVDTFISVGIWRIKYKVVNKKK